MKTIAFFAALLFAGKVVMPQYASVQEVQNISFQPDKQGKYGLIAEIYTERIEAYHVNITAANTLKIITPEQGAKRNRRHRHVGELYGGGVVFYVDKTGRHGLICSMVDISKEGERWSNVWRKEQEGFSAIKELAQSESDGKINTNIIVKRGHEGAANLCDDYINDDYGTGIYNDWYLPSIEELKLLYQAKSSINETLENDGNPLTKKVQDKYYWSSTEHSAGIVSAYTFFLGDYSRPHKSYYYWVRAIRSF